MFVLWSRPSFPGAGWRRVEYFSRYFAGRGFSVYVLGSVPPSYMLRGGVEVQGGGQSERGVYSVLSIQPYMGLSRVPARALGIIVGLVLVLALLVLRPGVVVVSVPSAGQVLASYIASRLVGARLVVDIRDPHEDYIIMRSRGLARRLFKFLKKLNFVVYRRADAVTTVTEGLARYLARHGVKAVLAPNGADTTVFKPYTEAGDIRRSLGLDGARVIVFSGYLGDYYRIDALLESLARLVKRGEPFAGQLRLVIVGGMPGRYRGNLVRRVRELGIDGLVMVLGVIESPVRLAQLLSACDVGLIPRVGDPFFDYAIPVKFYEYIACGLPVFVLARRGSDLWRIVERYRIGYVCEPHDTACIEQVLRDIARGRRLGELRARVLRLRRIVSREEGARRLYNTVKQFLASEHM